jgi:radical SAM-linked protein
MRVFQRAFVRAGIEIKYSQGFNPRPKLSLPLPRPVGVESDEELLCIKAEGASFDISDFSKRLFHQLPEGIELINAEIAETKTSFQPRKVVYLLKVSSDYIDEKLQSAVKKLMAAKELNIERRTDSAGHIKKINVRDFLESVTLQGDSVLVACNVTQAGSIRVNEILELLDLNFTRLSAPPRRTSVV